MGNSFSKEESVSYDYENINNNSFDNDENIKECENLQNDDSKYKEEIYMDEVLF